MPSNSNLNVKFGDKIGTGNSVPTNTAASSTTAGNIYAAKNSVGEIEMYIDTPVDNAHNSTERKRLDPRIFVGGLSDVNVPGDPNATDAAKRAAIWDNYDVWIDTDGDPTGIATTTSDGLMSSDHVDTLTTTFNTLNALKQELDKLKLQIVSQEYWNNSSAETGSSSGTALNNMLTIVLPNSAVPSGGGNYHPGQDNTNSTIKEHIFNTVDTSSIIVSDAQWAINNSDGFGLMLPSYAAKVRSSNRTHLIRSKSSGYSCTN